MSNTNGQQHRYRIKSVATITGLSTHVIRKWEERYALIQPIRSKNGYRTFSEEDIQILLFLQTKLQDGETIGQIAQVGSVCLREAMQQLPINLSLIPPPFHQDIQALVQAARDHNLNQIQQKIDQWIRDMGLGAAMTTIIFPVLQVIGENSGIRAEFPFLGNIASVNSCGNIYLLLSGRDPQLTRPAPW